MQSSIIVKKPDVYFWMQIFELCKPDLNNSRQISDVKNMTIILFY